MGPGKRGLWAHENLTTQKVLENQSRVSQRPSIDHDVEVFFIAKSSLMTESGKSPKPRPLLTADGAGWCMSAESLKNLFVPV
jgi:hypothetical protein